MKVKPLKYKLSNDLHTSVDANASLFFAESLALQNSDNLKDIADSKDVISSGLAKCYLGKVSEGLDLLQSKYDRNRRNPSFWNAQGICFFLKKEPRKAVVFYNKALEHYPKYAPAYNNLGVAYIHSGMDQKAMVAFQKASSLHKNGLTSRFNELNLYLSYSLLQPAEETLNQLEKNYGAEVKVRNARAVWHMMSGRDAAAVNILAALGNETLEDPQYGLNFVVALYRMGQQKKARKFFDDIDKDKLGLFREYYSRVAGYIGESL